MRSDELAGVEIPPAAFFSHHPLANTWTKLTCADLCGLHQPASFHGQSWYFHLNHPLRHVSLLGIITSISFFGPTSRYLIVNIDDGSGRSVECKSEVLDAAVSRGNVEGKEEDGDVTSEPRLRTTTEQVRVHSVWRHVLLAGLPLEEGMLLKVKGVPSSFRDTTQLRWLRASIVKSTDVEAAWWASYAETVRTTLAHPWVVTERIAKRVRVEESRLRVDEANRTARQEKRHARRQSRAEREERWRRHEERKHRGAPLPGL